MTTAFRLFKGLHYIIDKDTHTIHKISKISNQCDIGPNKEYLNSDNVRNYQIYDYKVKQCPHCFPPKDKR